MFCALNYNCSFVYEIFRGFPVKIAFFLVNIHKSKRSNNYNRYLYHELFNILMVAENNDVKIS